MGGKGSGRKEDARRVAVVGRETADPTAPIPARVIGTIQHGGAAIPDACPHCHAAWRQVLANEAHCLCGLIFFRTAGEVGR